MRVRKRVRVSKRKKILTDPRQNEYDVFGCDGLASKSAQTGEILLNACHFSANLALAPSLWTGQLQHFCELVQDLCIVSLIDLLSEITIGVTSLSRRLITSRMSS